MSNGKIRAVHHHLRPLVARDADEPHRTATSLELLYDLTLVVAFSVAGSQLAHALAAGHVLPGLAAFGFVTFGAVWAWMAYTRFASAYDNDDWFVRGAVMMQMIGVLILSLGIPELFHGLEDGWQVHNQIIVVGYVVMRLALVGLWWRAGSNDTVAGRACRLNAVAIVVVQLGWIAQAVVHLPRAIAWTVVFMLYIAELSLPYLSETRVEATSWHPHHLAERYGLLLIIALGEGIVGVSASLEALYEHFGWSAGVLIVLFAGVSITVGMWWVYFSIPFGEILEAHRDRVFRFAYPHIVMYAAVAAAGAGLHLVALKAEGESELSNVGTMLGVVVPIGIFLVTVYVVFEMVLREHGYDPFHVLLLALTVLALAASVMLAAAGASLGVCLIVAMLAPWVSVIGFEALGHKHINARMALIDEETA